MSQNKRTDKRIPLQKECTLVTPLGLIETLIVDMSIMGLGVTTDRTVPFQKGCELSIFIQSVENLLQAELMWTKKDFNNATRIGLKFSGSINN